MEYTIEQMRKIIQDKIDILKDQIAMTERGEFKCLIDTPEVTIRGWKRIIVREERRLAKLG